MKMIPIFILALAVFLALPIVYGEQSLTINKEQWKILKQEKGTIAYIRDKYSKTPLICEVYPNAKNKNDLPSRNIYAKNGKLDSSALVNAKNKKAVVQQKIDDSWADCYSIIDENQIQIGDSSTIIVYQDYSTIEYIDGDNNETITTFLLEKFNGIEYKIEPNDIWVRNESGCFELGKEGLCFGATDNSMNETQSAQYKYIINSTSDFEVTVMEEEGYTYPIVYTSYILPSWGEKIQGYNFKDICQNSYSNCDWETRGNSLTIEFVSKKHIDPTIFPVGNGTLANPYQITNCSYLQAMNESLTSYYILMNNIDCSWINFKPIHLGSIFSGGLEGQNYNITNLNISYDGSNRVGLFSDFSGIISNVNIVNANVIANYDVGVLVGYGRGGTIVNSSVRNAIVTGTSGTGNIGGFVGRNFATILNSFVYNSSVIGSSVSASGVGGFVGMASTGSNINLSGVNQVLVSTVGVGTSYTGGFVGRAEAPFYKDYAINVNVTTGGSYSGGFCGYSATSSASISNSWATGTVLSGGTYTGGFVGRLSAPITDCYSTANVTSSADYVGGFIGYTTTSIINSSYSVGLVRRTSAGSYMGGFAGRTAGGTIASCYYDNQTSNQTDTGKGLGLNTTLMKKQSSFVGWDFSTPIWYIIENQTYPSLIPLSPVGMTISFTSPTEISGTYLQRNNILVNATSTNGGSINTTIYLYDSNKTLISSNLSSSNPYFINYTNLPEGLYYFNATSTNGISIVSTETRNVTLDTTNPNASLLSPIDNLLTNISTQNYSVNVSDNLAGIRNITLWIYNNATSTLNYSSTVLYLGGILKTILGIPVLLADGVYNWFFSVFDYAGNQNITMNRTITIDSTSPYINIISPLNQTYTNATLLVNLSSDGTTIWWSNGTIYLYTSPVEVTFSQGSNTIIAYANDTFGNLNSSTVTFSISTILPSSNIDFVFTPTDNTYLNYSLVKIDSFCYDTDYNLCGSDVNCSISIFYPNSSLMVDKGIMTWTSAYYFYDLNSSQTSINGNYNGIVRCNDATKIRISEFVYVISPTGRNINEDVYNVPENVWNYINGRNLTYYPTTNASINPEDIWSYPNGRNLTYYPPTNVNLTGNISVTINSTDIANAVWSYNGTISNNILNQFTDQMACVLNQIMNPEGWGIDLSQC